MFLYATHTNTKFLRIADNLKKNLKVFYSNQYNNGNSDTREELRFLK